MKTFYMLIISLLIATIPSFAQNQPSANDIILKMQHDLNLSQDQVANITQIIERYVDASNDLQKSIEDGTINQSAIDSQKQQLKAAEEQGIAQYLRPDQLNEWQQMESQPSSNNNDSPDDTNQYSNYPK